VRRSSGTKCRIETQHGRPQPGLDTPLRGNSTDGCSFPGQHVRPPADYGRSSPCGESGDNMLSLTCNALVGVIVDVVATRYLIRRSAESVDDLTLAQV